VKPIAEETESSTLQQCLMMSSTGDDEGTFPDAPRFLMSQPTASQQQKSGIHLSSSGVLWMLPDQWLSTVHNNGPCQMVFFQMNDNNPPFGTSRFQIKDCRSKKKGTCKRFAT